MVYQTTKPSRYDAFLNLPVIGALYLGRVLRGVSGFWWRIQLIKRSGKTNMPAMFRGRVALGIMAGGGFFFFARTSAQFRYGGYNLPDPIPAQEEHSRSEFQMARVKYRTFGEGGSHGIRQPWWAIDYPYAEEHFFAALRRSTNITVADQKVFLELSDERIFQYPFLFLQAVGVGNWSPTAIEAAKLREHLLRGGFMLVDDFHGEGDWAIFEHGIRGVFPDRQIPFAMKVIDEHESAA